MAATLLHRDRLDFDDGAVVEMIIWQVPAHVAVSDFLADVAEERES